MNVKEEYFKLFSTCDISKGANRSLIFDFQRNFFSFIPNDLTNIIYELNREYCIRDIYKKYGNKNKETLDDLFTFLIDNELGFYCGKDEYNNFPKLKKNFDVPSKITNAIIEISDLNSSDISKIMKNLNGLMCKHIQFIFYESFSFEFIENILNKLKSINLRSVQLILRYNEQYSDLKILYQLEKADFRITNILLHSAPKDKIINPNSFSTLNIQLTTKKILSSKCCGNITGKNFSFSFELFLESQNYNSCLNRKISIDKDGNIKNCPGMLQSFGNIKNTTLQEALVHRDFKKYWNITKDQIHICKDCEFRYVCTDCRAYRENPEDDYSKPLKCGYNPYTNEWKEWSTNPSKQKAIEYYGMEDLVKKND